MFFDLFCLSSPLWPWQSSPPVKFSASYNTSFTSLAQFAAVTVRSLLLYVCCIFLKIHINKTTKHMIVSFFVWTRKIIHAVIMDLGVACMYFHSLSTFSLSKKKERKNTWSQANETWPKSVGTVSRGLISQGPSGEGEGENAGNDLQGTRTIRHLQDGRWSVQDKPCRAKILQKWLFCQKERVCSARKGKTKGIQRFFCGRIWRYSVPSGSVDLSVVLLLDPLRLPAWLSAKIRAWEIKSAQGTRK